MALGDGLSPPDVAMTIREIHSIWEFYYSPGPLYIFVFLLFLTSINSRFTTSDNSKQNIGHVRQRMGACGTRRPGARAAHVGPNA